MERIKRVDIVLNIPNNAEIKKGIRKHKNKTQGCYETTAREVVSGDALSSNDSLLIASDDFKIHGEIIKNFKLWILP